MESGAQAVSSWAEIGRWVLIGMSFAVAAGFGILWLIRHWSEITIPSIAHPWQNALLQAIGVLLAIILIILYYFY